MCSHRQTTGFVILKLALFFCTFLLGRGWREKPKKREHKQQSSEDEPEEAEADDEEEEEEEEENEEEKKEKQQPIRGKNNTN